MEKPDFEPAALRYTNDGIWGYPFQGDEPGQMMFREISKAYNDGCEHVWTTHVVPLQENMKILSDHIVGYEAENKLLREENKHLISKYVNLEEINVTTYASHTKEELIKELNYHQNVVCAAKDNTNRMLLEEIERLKAELNFKQGCIDAKKLDV